ncbi:DNA gyrase/topoisomerase IV subunit A [Bacillus subtilis]|uniref:DNA gyrase/topoisomerase IV subunit A n=1 Tax=Bacillus subtilis TaxID=1423 RepID=UPI00129D5EFD|nr:DNA topoisomerase (ATP-hydrolyzing) subunit A [Bacillus subtilis]MEC2217468.1 DNA topoisomerase (ATP-hydrolyzing) subunit A [Bacillus subtilis]QGI15740.1 DNA topoisomerase [Bacillus subtilis]CAF1775828.1 DNA gyrase subunit A [Bacillus subtilis]CAF1851307.1 DNA gyrase subunit A [Bacillus subtilis]CAI6329661.1 DNA topoisomerase (ATP-hydrolyzing) [Bacillus subtilis]
MTTTNKNIEQIIENNMMEYSAYILLDRALPDLRDGLKPVHRRILYSMYLQKAFKFTKSANVAGQVMKLHPHGSSYGSMVGMVQKDRHIIPMLEGKGNFGQYTSRDLMPAADRYSEVKLSEISIDMMQNFDKNVVDFIDNYDGTMKMPEVLPVKFPSILAYSNSGIGVGFSSSIPSFNLKELTEAIVKYIETGEKTVLVPDFATGGLIVKEDNVFRQLNEEGRGTVKIRGKAEIVKNEIHITEIPYSTTREAIIEKIVELNKAGKLKEVTDVKDLTGLKGMLITITARRNTDMNVLLEKLYKFTPLQSTFSANMNMLVDDLPKVLGVWQTIDKWLEWRTTCIKRGLSHDIETMTRKLHLLQGLEKVLLDIDEAIEIIRRSSQDQIEPNLQKHFGIDFEQAKEVANMKLRNINREYIIKKIEDIDKFEKTIENYKMIVKSQDKINQIIIKGLNETKEKYGKERRTKIVELTEVKPVRLVEEVPNYAVTIYLTKEGYCYKFKGNQEPNLKPGDEVLKVFETENKAEILIFGSDRVCHKVELKDIDETRANALGTYLPNMIRDKNITIVSYSILDSTHKFIIAAYSNNRIAKINLEAFQGNRTILKNSYCLKQDLLDMITLENDVSLNLLTDKSKLTVDTKNFNLTNGRNATGVYASPSRKLKKIEVA